MAISANALVIGLTGPFGSGCSTSAQNLESRLQFSSVKLSTSIRKEWDAKHPGVEPSREDLQKLGDELRKEHGGNVLVKRVIDEMTKDDTQRARIVIDGVRNVQEVKFLQQRFGHGFFLFALECPQSVRYCKRKDRTV